MNCGWCWSLNDVRECVCLVSFFTICWIGDDVFGLQLMLSQRIMTLYTAFGRCSGCFWHFLYMFCYCIFTQHFTCEKFNMYACKMVPWILLYLSISIVLWTFRLNITFHHNIFNIQPHSSFMVLIKHTLRNILCQYPTKNKKLLLKLIENIFNH